MFEEIRRQQELQKANILRGFGINPENEDLELEIFKAQETDIEKAKHQDGDMHPNGKWVWVASANGGKGDWRTAGGRAHKKHQAGGGAGNTSESESGAQKTTEEHTSKELSEREIKKKPTSPSNMSKKEDFASYLQNLIPSSSRHGTDKLVSFHQAIDGSYYGVTKTSRNTYRAVIFKKDGNGGFEYDKRWVSKPYKTIQEAKNYNETGKSNLRHRNSYPQLNNWQDVGSESSQAK